jgi:hypothetical protein
MHHSYLTHLDTKNLHSTLSLAALSGTIAGGLV